MYKDLREFIDLVDRLGALRRIDGADPRFEIGGITEVAAGRPDCPALLFDNIKGYRHGLRVFTNATTNVQRAALALGLDPDCGRSTHSKRGWRNARLCARCLRLRSATPSFCKTRSPAPMSISRAFRRRPGTGTTADLSSARARLWSCAIRITAGSMHRSIASRSTDRTKSPCSSTMADGMARSSPENIGIAAKAARSPWCTARIRRCSSPASNICRTAARNTSFAGAIKGAPIEVCAGPQTGLPLPAHAEMVFEGRLLPMRT